MQKTIRDIYFIIVVLFSGYSIAFFRSAEGIILLWTIGLFLFGKTLFKFPKKLFFVLGVWVGYFVINTIIVGSVHPLFFFIYFVKIMIAYLLIDYYGSRIFIKYEKLLYYLTLISLFFYIWQFIDSNSIFSLISKIDLSDNLFPDNKRYASIVLYTINIQEVSSMFPRNAGFCWEPGPFSSYISLAILFNLAHSKLKIIKYNHLIVFVVAIITSQSTTGLLALFAIILWFSWSRFKNNFLRFFTIPITVTVVVLLFIYIPFLQSKIMVESSQNIDALIDNSITNDITYAPGRFVSLQMGWEDFKNYPIAGIGGKVELLNTTRQGASISTINGLANIMTRYGTIGLILFFYLLFKSGRWISIYYKYKGFFIFPAMILIIAFGFSIIENPIIFTFLMMGTFEKTLYKNKNYKYKNSKMNVKSFS